MDFLYEPEIKPQEGRPASFTLTVDGDEIHKLRRTCVAAGFYWRGAGKNEFDTLEMMHFAEDLRSATL